MQAIYHGKPVIAMPFFGDQLNNADKMVSKVGQARPPHSWSGLLMDVSLWTRHCQAACICSQRRLRDDPFSKAAVLPECEYCPALLTVYPCSHACRVWQRRSPPARLAAPSFRRPC